MTKPTKVFVNPKKNIIGKVNTYRAKRILQISGTKRWPGELVPEAHTWLRAGNYVHGGSLAEEQIPESEFDAAVAQYCPHLTEELAYKAKGMAVAVDHDPKFTGFQTDADGNVIDMAAIRREARLAKQAATAPNDRVPPNHMDTTPAGLEASTPDDMHSDGGSTLWQEEPKPVAQPKQKSKK